MSDENYFVKYLKVARFWDNQQKGHRKGYLYYMIEEIKSLYNEGKIKEMNQSIKETFDFIEEYRSYTTLWRFKKELKEMGIEWEILNFIKDVI